MTYYKRDLLQQYGDSIEDGEKKAAFNAVIKGHRFSSDKPDAVTYEGEFQRALETAGLADLVTPLTLSYREQVLDMAGQ